MKFRTPLKLVANAKRRKRKRVKNPLRVDPSRTATIRRRWVADLRRRFARLRAEVLRLVVEEDAFGLDVRPRMNAAGPVANAGRWAFESDSRKADEFERWLTDRIGKDVLGDQDVWARYAEEGVRLGMGRAFDDVRRSGRALAQGDKDRMSFYAGGREEFLRSAFRQPASIERVKVLAGRTFTDLKGVSAAMATAMRRTLADGLVKGQSARDVARELTKSVDGIGRRRSEVVARSELIRAHAEGQLDGMKAMGVDRVGVMVEFLATEDGRQCPECAELSGIVMSIDEARGIIPVHPQCRCVWLPAGVGEEGGERPDAEEVAEEVGGEDAEAALEDIEIGGVEEGAAPAETPGEDETSEERPYSEADRVTLRERMAAVGMERAVEDWMEERGRDVEGVKQHGMSRPEAMREVEIDGVKFRWPRDAISLSASPAADIANIVSDRSVPRALWSAQREVTFSSQRNSEDAVWEKRYGMAGFRSRATGGDGQVVVYDERLPVGSFNHEAGHNLARGLWGVSAPPPTSRYFAAQVEEPPVSKYGGNSQSEDFAEACRLYADPRERGNFERDFPMKFAAVKDIMGD